MCSSMDIKVASFFIKTFFELALYLGICHGNRTYHWNQHELKHVNMSKKCVVTAVGMSSSKALSRYNRYVFFTFYELLL